MTCVNSALLVNLRNLNRELVADFNCILNRSNAFIGQLGNMAKSFLAEGNFHERAS